MLLCGWWKQLYRLAQSLDWANAVTTGSADDVWMVRIMLVLRSPKENFQDFTWSGNVRPAVGNNTASSLQMAITEMLWSQR